MERIRVDTEVEVEFDSVGIGTRVFINGVLVWNGPVFAYDLSTEPLSKKDRAEFAYKDMLRALARCIEQV